MNRKERWTIGLTIVGLLFGLHTFARAEAIRFYMALDTTRQGIRLGQEFELRYICTADYDSVALPVFGGQVEAIEGPVSHKAGRAVEDGVLTDLYEYGFSYRIRFLREGKIVLPVSRVRVKGKAYATPPASVWVQPVMATIDSVKCRLQLSDSYRKGERSRMMLTCNRRPDSRRPRLLVNGNYIEPSGHGLSQSGGKEEYSFYYSVVFEEDGSYICTCDSLTFGGIPYPMEEQEIVVGNPGRAVHKASSRGLDLPVLVMTGLYLLMLWGAVWLRFRKEGREELACFVRRNKYLNLTTWWALTHYGFPLALVGLPVFFVGLNAYSYYVQGKADFPFPLFWGGLLPMILAFVLYRRQRAKLFFQSVQTSLPLETLQAVMLEVARAKNWTIDYIGDDCMVAHTNPSIWSGTWGEQVFVVFDRNEVWVNSVNNLDKRSALVSFGRTKRNIRWIKEAISEREKGE